MGKRIERDIGKRWEQALPHHPKSVELYRWLADFDHKECGDTFCWRSGGDGDNGETLMYQLDVYFEEQDSVTTPRKRGSAVQKVGSGFHVWTDWVQHVPKESSDWLPSDEDEPARPYVWAFDEDWGDGGSPTLKLFRNEPWAVFGSVYRVDGGNFQAFLKPLEAAGKPRRTIKRAALDLYNYAQQSLK